ncbi:MAG: 3-phosphoshikimate 1-carboxyvinyltransferase [Eubacterium sp.]|nr:3-phosphoshikimate 1-carboxyvinyltransferase [Eubacterium sp.]MBR7060949.1 3-phosphoshikimate 1-carboxyvinyltransferase [Eubacterium sp.]
MSIAIIENSILKGEVRIPPSKSAAHRALICSFLSCGGSVEGIIDSSDMKATEGALEALKNGDKTINCLESGSTLRFIIPVAAALGKSVSFSGCGRLPERPIGEYISLLEEHGVCCKSNKGFLPLEISGKLKSGIFRIRGDVSSQYITGLLLALPLLDGKSEIVLTSPLQSKPYVDMTIKVLKDFGINIEETENGYAVFGNQKFKSCRYTVEGDWSQAAFFLAAGAVCGDVKVCGLDMDSAQGDKKIVDILKEFGADIQINGDWVEAKKSCLRGITIDAKDIPDMVPALSVVAANAEGKTVINNIQRLRLKESDRVLSIVSNLKKAGIKAFATENKIEIEGSAAKGAKLSGFNDHRIVMAFSVLALTAQGKTEISDALSINKSYPAFFEDYNKLGGKAYVIGNRE